MSPAYLVLALFLAAPLATAEPAPPVRACAEVGCVVAVDTDGDGDHDWMNVAIVPGGLHTAGLAANRNESRLSWEVSAGTEEALPHEAHEPAEELGLSPPETFHVLIVEGTAQGGESATSVRLAEGDEATGAWRDLYVVSVKTDLVLP